MRSLQQTALWFTFAVVQICFWARPARAQLLDKQAQLDAQTFWDNRDWDWYAQNIPFFECPDSDITTTYYYRWELLTKHLTYGSPNSGYSFTEFIDRPFWSGAYGAISCPAGHQLYEARWLRQPRIARDYARYWFRTPGAQPRNYSTWLADSVWAVNQIHPDDAFTFDLLPDLIANYEAWERGHFVPEVGLFWQTGHDDGMEYNINSRQTKDILRGSPSYRPSFNAYMWADAMAIARIAERAGNVGAAQRFRTNADALKEQMQALLWDPKRQFFFPMFRDDEQRDGHQIQAGTLTYQSGQFADDPHGRELIGYVPWQFNMLDDDKGDDDKGDDDKGDDDKGDDDKGYEVAWKKLMDPDAFYAPFGPTTVERNDPMFLLQKSCCWWSGQSWPYATTQTLKGLGNLLQNGESSTVTGNDYLKLLRIYARSHRKDSRPYLAEALHPDTGSFEGHDAYNHSEHYFHSGYCDLVITGLVGFVPINEASFELRPLAPPDWDWFALDDLPYQERRISIVWDRLGTRYGQGAGLSVLVDGEKVASSEQLQRLRVTLPPLSRPANARSETVAVNFAVNNDGTYYPRLTASHTAPGTSLGKLCDGNYWYMQHPPNRWTCEGSQNDSDWVVVDFGTQRLIHTLKLYLLDDSGLPEATPVRAPRAIQLQVWLDNSWQPVVLAAEAKRQLLGHRATVINLEEVETSKLRLIFTHAADAKSGLTEIEAWGNARLPVEQAPPPSGNLAYNSKGEGYPKAIASFTDRFGGKPASAIDGKTVFAPTPMNRWTSYESKSPNDWLEIDLGTPREFRRVELAIYDDRGGVQPPSDYAIEYWTDDHWRAVDGLTKSPEQPAGGVWNEARFEPVTAQKVRIVFTHRGQARSGITELLIWND